MIKVLLVDDHSIVRNGIRSLLSSQPNITVVAEAANGIEVLNLLDEGLEADLILTDIDMPTMNGISMMQELISRASSTKVLVLSMVDSETEIIQAINCGASGYLLKNVCEEELVFAIKHVSSGNLYICSEIVEKTFVKFNSNAESSKSGNSAEIHLSKREHEILQLIAEGFTNNEIAEKLFTSRRTAEGHRQNLLDKTGARNTATLIRYAVIQGLLN